MTDDGWKFTAEHAGTFDTRHEAIGAETVAVRERLNAYPSDLVDDTVPLTFRVYAHKPYVCGYCGETFLTETTRDDHKPCPAWVKDGQPGYDPRPDHLFLPADESSGSCYHAAVCGAHTLEKVPIDDALPRIKANDLTPCSNCQEHHGLNFGVDTDA